MVGVVAPARIQLSRASGWRMPPHTIKVDRSTQWGNPFRVEQTVDIKCAKRWGWWPLASPDWWARNPREAVDRFRAVLAADEAIHGHVRHELAGHNLACWCDLDGPCHADVLLAFANQGDSR